jgi:electron transfer flavoprotein alpha/beta subunit
MKAVVCVEAGPLSDAARAALALAVKLRGELTSIIALAASPKPAPEALVAARRLGADRAVQLLDPGLDDTDIDALGRSLAYAVRILEGGVVLAGARSDGEGRGIVPAAIAHHLRVPYIAYVEELVVSGKEAKVLLRAGGRKRRLAVPLPAVLTTGAASALAASPREGGDVTIETIAIEAHADDTRPIRVYPLGQLERPRRKPATASSPAELVRRWLERG